MICVFGSINIDFIVNTSRLPLPGETVTGNRFVTVPGGKGANQALAATRAGASVKMAGAIGRDNFAQMAIEFLDKAGTDLDFVKTTDAPTGTAFIFVDEKGENMIAVVGGANGCVNSDDAETLLNTMGAGDSILLQMEIGHDAVKAALLKARKHRVRSVFNIAPTTPETINLAPLADIIIANETEFDLLTGKGDLSSQERQNEMKNYAENHKRSIVITLGGKGAIAWHEGVFMQVKALSVKPLDTIGAGDTFCGYLTQGLDSGLDFQKALQQAAIAGSLACLKPGAQPSIPTIDEVIRAIE